MSIRTTAPSLIASIASAVLLLTGCGSSGKTAATSTAPTATATMVGRDTPPAVGSASGSKAKHTPTMATGRHDHAGEFCSGRNQAPYAREHLICVTGRLKPKR